MVQKVAYMKLKYKTFLTEYKENIGILRKIGLKCIVTLELFTHLRRVQETHLPHYFEK